MAKQWCLDGAFKTNAIYNRLANMDYDYVVGLDIGDGESMAYVYDAAQNKTDRLHFSDSDSGDDKKISTMIAITKDGSVVIGGKASKQPNFRQHFKKAPSQWNTAILEQNGKTYTFKYLMKLFISTFWSAILKNDDRGEKLKEARNQNKLLIAVGCPSSTLWTGQNEMSEYQKLVREATGCNNVTILAESTAAIMSALKESKESEGKMDLNRGIVIFDAGSSTIDFTYVLLGKKLITCSLPVAGAELDKRLLATALKHSGLSEDDIPEEQEQNILVQFREMKESYYPDKVNLGPKPVGIWERNSYGMVDKNLPSKKYLNFVFNSDFVNEAIDTKYRLSPTEENPMSWLGRCRKFADDCFALVGTCPCSKVILTGGTSFVAEFKDAVVKAAEDAHIGGKNVVESTQRDASVARGLCYAKELEIAGKSRVEAYKRNVEAIADKNYVAFLTSLSEYMSQAICDDMLQVLNYYVGRGEPVLAGKLLDTINQVAQQDKRLTGEICEDKVRDIFETHFKNAQSAPQSTAAQSTTQGTKQVNAKTTLLEEVNDASKSIYGAVMSEIPEIPKPSKKELQDMVGKLDLNSVINSAWIKGVVSKTVIQNVCLAFSAVLAYINPIVGAVFFAVAQMEKGEPDFQQKVAQFIMKDNTSIKLKTLKKLQQKLSKSGEQKEIARDIASSMRKSNTFAKEFKGCVTDTAEAYLGKVLFLVYDERPVEK